MEGKVAERKDVIAESVIIITFDPDTREPIIKTQNTTYHQMKVAGQDLFTVGDEMHRTVLRDEITKASREQAMAAQKKAQDAALLAKVADDIKRGKQ